MHDYKMVDGRRAAAMGRAAFLLQVMIANSFTVDKLSMRSSNSS